MARSGGHVRCGSQPVGGFAEGPITGRCIRRLRPSPGRGRGWFSALIEIKRGRALPGCFTPQRAQKTQRVEAKAAKPPRAPRTQWPAFLGALGALGGFQVNATPLGAGAHTRKSTAAGYITASRRGVGRDVRISRARAPGLNTVARTEPALCCGRGPGRPGDQGSNFAILPPFTVIVPLCESVPVHLKS